MIGTFQRLPDEVIQSIIFYLPPADLHSLQLTSIRLNRLANSPLLWRYHCRTQYKYWDSKHQIREKLAGPVLAVDWKELYAFRHRVARRTIRALDGIISSETGRIEAFKGAVEPGYDVKDTLLQNIRVEEGEEDVLARRYWSNAVLGHLQRKMALQLFILGGSPGVLSTKFTLERALTAFDMCVLEDREGDFEEVFALFDLFAEQFRQSNPSYEEYTTRQKAVALANFIREHGLTGVEEGEDYMQVENSFIGFALRDDKHRSMPLVSVGIYCALATRLAIDAKPVGYPFHVYAIIVPPPSLTLDGRPHLDPASPAAPMYLDPFRTPDEVPIESLHRQLNTMGVPLSNHGPYLSPASTTAMAIRVCHNLIHASIERNISSQGGRAFVDRGLARYTAVWALIHLDRTALLGPDNTQFMHYLLSKLETYPEDIPLFEDHLRVSTLHHPQHSQWRVILYTIIARDQAPKLPKQRAENAVKYRVGQVFRHKRYAYKAIITGWDTECKAEDDWVRQMAVDRLPGGRKQAFYDSAVEDGSTRYVAEENIEIVSDWVPGPSIMKTAGRYFKRWDKEAGRFVSNRKEEYPDD